MNRFLYVLFFVLLCFINTSFADILRTSDFRYIQNQILREDRNSLIIFDIDDVLLWPVDQILKLHNRQYLTGRARVLGQRIASLAVQDLSSIVLLQHESRLVDPRMVSLIKRVQARGIKVLALTNCYTGPFGRMESLETWRIKKLKEFGYHFDRSWSLEDKLFVELESKTSKQSPMFKRGVVFVGSSSKGDALNVFLQYVDFKPKKIIFIDDQRKNLESVEMIADRLGIQFIGIEYVAAQDSKMEPLNEELIDLQFKVLETEHRYISDKEAKKLLLH